MAPWRQWIQYNGAPRCRPVVVWIRIYRIWELAGSMQARPGICRGLTFGADHNKSGTNRIRIASHPVGTERQTGGLPMRSSKSQVQGSKEIHGLRNQTLPQFPVESLNFDLILNWFRSHFQSFEKKLKKFSKNWLFLERFFDRFYGIPRQKNHLKLNITIIPFSGYFSSRFCR